MIGRRSIVMAEKKERFVVLLRKKKMVMDFESSVCKW